MQNTGVTVAMDGIMQCASLGSSWHLALFKLDDIWSYTCISSLSECADAEGVSGRYYGTRL